MFREEAWAIASCYNVNFLISCFQPWAWALSTSTQKYFAIHSILIREEATEFECEKIPSDGPSYLRAVAEL